MRPVALSSTASESSASSPPWFADATRRPARIAWPAGSDSVNAVCDSSAGVVADAND
jgi:hypothetical protein